MPRPEFVLSTKVGRLLRPDANAARDQNSYVQVLPFAQRWDYSAGGVQRSIEDSLQRLGMATVDVAYIHDCDATVHGANYPQVLRQVLDEALPQLRHMQQQGLVGHIGLGVNDVQVCLDVLAQADLDCLMLAGRYTLVDHSALEICCHCAHDAACASRWAGFGDSGHRRQRRRHRRCSCAAAPGMGCEGRRGRGPVHQARGAAARRRPSFPLAHPAVEIVMLGAQHVGHWHDACHHIRQPIPAAFWAELQALGVCSDTAAIPPAQPAPRL